MSAEITTSSTIAGLMAEIERCLPDGGHWCDLEKAHTLAALVIGLRPLVVCEIGVWMGGSLVPMALAMRALRDLDIAANRLAVERRVIAIDPWAAAESCAGQDETNTTWWSQVDHDQAMKVFLGRLEQHGLQTFCEVVRAPSDSAPVPSRISLLHVDGNHAEQARRDVARFGPAVELGGLLVIDDLGWSGGHVQSARELAGKLGFQDLYPLGTGMVMRRADVLRVGTCETDRMNENVAKWLAAHDDNDDDLWPSPITKGQPKMGADAGADAGAEGPTPTSKQLAPLL